MNVKLNGEHFFRQTADWKGLDSVHTVPHNGIDLATKCGTPLPSPVNGFVENEFHIQGHVNVGTGLKLQTPEGEHVILGHMQKLDVHKGQEVHIGQILGETGNTGNSTGCHLHVGAKSVDNSHFIDPTKFAESIQHLAHELLDASWSTIQCILLHL